MNAPAPAYPSMTNPDVVDLEIMVKVPSFSALESLDVLGLVSTVLTSVLAWENPDALKSVSKAVNLEIPALTVAGSAMVVDYAFAIRTFGIPSFSRVDLRRLGFGTVASVVVPAAFVSHVLRSLFD